MFVARLGGILIPREKDTYLCMVSCGSRIFGFLAGGDGVCGVRMTIDKIERSSQVCRKWRGGRMQHICGM